MASVYDMPDKLDLKSVFTVDLKPTIPSILLYFIGLIIVWASYFAGNSVFPYFVIVFFTTIVFNLPEKALSPLSIFYAYYGAWFVIAPMFAERYQGELDSPEYMLAIAMAYTVFGIGVISIKAGECLGKRIHFTPIELVPVSNSYLTRWISVLYIFCTAMIGMIVYSSGGIEIWLNNPGDAFLNRSGSGIYVILSHFSSIALAALSGYFSFKAGKIYPALLYLAWVSLTSPVHGSKIQVAILVIVLFLPWLRELKLLSIKTIFLYVSFLGIFILGLYFRNLSWIDVDTMIPYALNYFTALENLMLSVRDFEPGFITTFFLPFVKFLTPFGLSDPSMYYDMNHMLTDHYYPHAWEIRATEQWPVETDLYLNFFFFGGIPLVAAYLFVVGVIYGRALTTTSLGTWLAAFLMIIFMISHLRGSLYNHVDFYMYPYIFVMYFLFRKLPLISDNE